MKILLISGFLGAGKTSFIKALAKATGREFVILENEFASQDVDSQILKQDESGAQLDIWELTEGCICCSLNLDFSFSVMTIANTLKPDYLIVEPSGVALPSKIIDSLTNITYEKIALLAPVTVIDADNYSSQREEFTNYFSDQLLTAGTVVLSKSEQLDETDFSEIAKDLTLQGDVAFPMAHYSKWLKEDWLEFLHKELSAKDMKQIGQRFTKSRVRQEADLDLESLTLDHLDFVNIAEVYGFMTAVLQGHYGQIVRAKGFVTLEGETVHVEFVQNKFSLCGLGRVNLEDLPEGEAGESQVAQGLSESKKAIQDRLVLIGKNIQKDRLQQAGLYETGS